MPTLYPKCTPSEMLGFLVVLNTHGGSQEIARLAEEENLAIDKLLPAVDYAHGLGLVTVDDGRATLTDSGRMLLAADIRVRKVLLREVLKRTILFRAILRSLEQSVDSHVAEDEIAQIVAFTTAPPEAIQDIINWGRYTELFRYDARQHTILPIGIRGGGKVPPPIPLPAAVSRAPPKPPTVKGRPPKEASPPAKPSNARPGPATRTVSSAPTVSASRPATPSSSGATSASDPSKKKLPPTP